MATKTQIEAAIAQQKVQLANVKHAKETIELRRDAVEKRHANDVAELEKEKAEADARIERIEKEIGELEKALAD